MGIRLDPRLTFLYQIQYSANKIYKIVGQHSGLMANIRGPQPARRRLLTEVTNSIMLYGNEILVETLEVKKRLKSGKIHLYRYRERLHCVTRRHIIVSDPGVLVIIGTIPVDLLAIE